VRAGAGHALRGGRARAGRASRVRAPQGCITHQGLPARSLIRACGRGLGASDGAGGAGLAVQQWRRVHRGQGQGAEGPLLFHHTGGLAFASTKMMKQKGALHSLALAPALLIPRSCSQARDPCPTTDSRHRCRWPHRRSGPAASHAHAYKHKTGVRPHAPPPLRPSTPTRTCSGRSRTR